jgi:ectoine hydroxylase-related dioxygenase (phytanoyl-CoA dioxygenase family)
MDSGFFTLDDCDLAGFRALTERKLDPAAVPLSARVACNVPLYEVDALLQPLSDPTARRALLAEWARVLGQFSGVLVLKGAYADTGVLDEAGAVYERIIAEEKASGHAKADHFAKAGANDRIWNSAQKLCVADPQLFARYFGNPAIAAVCEAWLGPGYQMTAQLNVVRPGGAAQEAHRDYHLGFQAAEVAARFPVHVHDLSATLTLQGGIAHCDMPVESGPTKLLPFSQLYRPGYMAYRRAEFREYFEQACVQLPLDKGDAIFFSPALFHAAGENRSTDIQRTVNLVQVSSAFGRAMEALDRDGMCRRLFPAIRDLMSSGRMTASQAEAAIAASAEGYAFPTNLDTDPPVGGLAPETQAGLFRRALDGGWSPAEFCEALDELASRRAA